mmetsp:Transcript_24876/g.32960  ORF Transcript_24876/g.32960 Transcript_24876/m.32960 type:complete len:117 (+) Transcript_24876:210-560(+)
MLLRRKKFDFRAPFPKKAWESTVLCRCMNPSNTSTPATTTTRRRIYRGVSSSISHMFQPPVSSPTTVDSNKTDCCSLACCGIFQYDHSRYLSTGILPPSLTRRFMTHLFSQLASSL